MIQNDRPMGEALGYWSGVEVEHTPFYGQPTLFFSRMLAVEKYLPLAKDAPHIFFAEINPLFWNGIYHNALSRLCSIVRRLLEEGKLITIECAPEAALEDQLTQLRKEFGCSFCLLIVVPVPQAEFGGFAIKVAPLRVFGSGEGESCVLTAAWNKFDATYWSQYRGDEDGHV